MLGKEIGNSSIALVSIFIYSLAYTDTKQNMVTFNGNS